MRTWDDEIDEAARQLTTGQPGPGFSTRVLARLGERPPRVWRGWLLVPAAAAIAVVVLIVPHEESRHRKVAPNRERAAVGLNDGRTLAEAGPPMATTTAPPAASSDRGGPPAKKASARAVASVGPADVPFVSELAPAPIDVPPLVVPAPAVDPLAELPPLAIEELTVEAIDFAQ